MGKNNTGSLGRALFKSRFSKAAANNLGSGTDRWLHTSELEDGADWNKINLKSVTEQSSLDEFLTTAELAGTDFQSERLNIDFVKPITNAGILTKEEQKVIKDLHEKHKSLLRIPRRPYWRETEYDASALQMKERESFLEWRRNLAILQENEKISMTPFEKNLEFWRQLWRVIERSDVIVQIVDARNPLLFYCEDLENYVKEIDKNKLNLVLINKSDFLTERQRALWLRYFEKKNVQVVFWSAVMANNLDKIDEETESSTSQQSNRKRTDSHRSELTTTDSESYSNNKSQEIEDGENEESDEENLDEINEEDEKDDDQDEKLIKNVNKFQILLEEKNSDVEEEKEDANKNDDQNKQETDDQEEEHEEDKDDQEDDEDDNDDAEDDVEENDDKKENVNKDNNPKDQNIKENKNSQIDKESEELATKMNQLDLTDEEKEKCKILTREELIDRFKTIHKSVDKAKPGCNTIGLVGYPNVGKSSTINALLKDKKVAVSETPGKTKHYQTLYVDDDLLLCDCPGLVFPSFVSTRGELIINGVLPIDQMRDYNEPINLVIHHVPTDVIEMIYGIEIPKPKEGQDPNRLPIAEELSSAYAIFRSYMNHKGMPDVQRAARYILKDYVNGKLLFCYPPPGHDEKTFQDHKYDSNKQMKYLEKNKKIQEKLKDKKPAMTNFDREFFTSMQPRALTKGGIVGYHRRHHTVQRGADVNNLNAAELEALGKPLKRHFNKNKREKLRRKTTHFEN